MARLVHTPDSQQWKCPICLDLLTDPAETLCCANLFCAGCLRGLTRCPLCKQVLRQWRLNIPVQRILNELQVVCSFAGCGQNIRRGDLKTHEGECEWMPVSCKYGCGGVPRHSLRTHEQACRLRPVLCKCGVSLSFCELSGHLSTVCPDVPQACPLTCGVTLKRGLLETHKSEECPNSLVTCRNLSSQSVFCGFVCLRKELPEHQLICQFRKVPCAYGCAKKVIYADLGKHGDICENRVVPCSLSCGEHISRRAISSHKEACPLEPVRCPFACAASPIIRRELSSHLQAEVCNHWTLTATRMGQLAREMEVMRKEVDQMRDSQRFAVLAVRSLISK